jgi:hypothetical protein
VQVIDYSANVADALRKSETVLLVTGGKAVRVAE